MSVRSELETFLGALRFFTRLPVPGQLGQDGVALEKAIRYYPVVGMIIGAVAAVAFALTSCFWPKTLAVLAAMVAAIYVTGAIHEDGWSDMVDGFGGGWTKERILDIMRDSCVGSFGATALVVMLLARFFALVEIDLRLVPIALIAGHALSRLCATCVLSALDYARSDGKAKAFSNRLGRGELLLATVTGLLPLLLFSPQQALLGLLLAVLSTLWLARMFKRQIGGYTGDCIGAVQQLAEVAFYCGLLVRFS
jgi:adenosylcobinamide-GDP ribazoletransferase